MFNHILVPLDGSALAERSIVHAERFARIFASKISLLRVLPVNPPQESPASIDPLNWQIHKAEAEMYLGEVAARIREHIGDLPHSENVAKEENRVNLFIREGRVAENILNFAHSQDVDLLVMSTHGWGGLSHWNVSSITQKVMNMVYLPMLIVRAYAPPEEEGLPSYRRILVPTDSSRRSECALSAAIGLATGEQRLPAGAASTHGSSAHEAPTQPLQPTRLIFASVLKLPELPIPEPYPPEVEELNRQYMHIGRAAVQQYLNTLKERTNASCEICLVESNHIAAAIHELAEEKDVDLVLMSAHGYTGRFTDPYGSVALHYIEYGARPVLVIQDVPRSQVVPTPAQLAAEKLGER